MGGGCPWQRQGTTGCPQCRHGFVLATGHRQGSLRGDKPHDAGAGEQGVDGVTAQVAGMGVRESHDAASMALGQYSSASAAAAACAQPGSGGRHSAARAWRRAQVLGGHPVTVSSSATVPVRGRYTPRTQAVWMACLSGGPKGCPGLFFPVLHQQVLCICPQPSQNESWALSTVTSSPNTTATGSPFSAASPSS